MLRPVASGGPLGNGGIRIFTSAPKKPWQRFWLLILCSLLLGCPDAEPDAAEDDSEPAVPVAVSPVKRDRIAATYKGTASIEARAEAEIVAKVGGVVETILAEEGDSVAAGQQLAMLDDERLKLELDRAQARYRQLSNELERQRRVFEKQLISRDEYDRKRFEVAAAKAELELAELNLRESVIRTPIAGVISARLIKTGNAVQIGQDVFRVTDLGALEARLHVPERDMRKLAVGQPASVHVDTWPEQRFAAEVLRINPVVDADTGTVSVILRMDNAEGKLRPGMFGRFRIEYDQNPDALLSPKAAVLIEDAAASVFVVSDGQSRRRQVRLGYDDDRYYEVLEGLQPGDKVVVTGQASLKDGVAAEIVETRDPG